MFNHMAVRAAVAESLKQLQTYNFETLTQVGLMPTIDEATSVVADVREADLMPTIDETTSVVTDVRAAGLVADTPAWINVAGLMTAPGNHQDGTEAPGSALEVAAALLQRSPSIGDPTASSAVTIPQSHQCEEPCKIDVGYFSKTAATRPRPMQMDMDAISNRVFMTYMPSPCKPDGFEEAKRDFWMERMAQRPGQMQGLPHRVRIHGANPFVWRGPHANFAVESPTRRSTTRLGAAA